MELSTLKRLMTRKFLTAVEVLKIKKPRIQLLLQPISVVREKERTRGRKKGKEVDESKPNFISICHFLMNECLVAWRGEFFRFKYSDITTYSIGRIRWKTCPVSTWIWCEIFGVKYVAGSCLLSLWVWDCFMLLIGADSNRSNHSYYLSYI